MANRLSKNRKLKRRLAYIAIPLIFAVIGLAATKVVVDMAYNKISTYTDFIASDTYIRYENDLYNNYTGYKGKQQKTFDNVDVAMPYSNEQYAVIKSEDLDIKAPLYWGDTDLALESGAGTYAGSSMPGYGAPILVSAHNTTYFKNLKNAKEGDIFVVNTNYAEFEYKVSKIEVKNIKSDEDIIDFDSTQEQLVLYTCYPFSPLSAVNNKRVFVYCDKVAGPVVENLEVDIG